MRIVAIIQARVGSSRLPGKVFADINGKPMLQRVYERVKKAKLLDDVVIATSFAEEDYQIVQWGQRNGIPVYRGGTTLEQWCISKGIEPPPGADKRNDVLGRYWAVAQQVKADVIVRITADCPMHDAEVIDQSVALLIDNRVDFVSNAIEPSFPDGLDCEVFTAYYLERANYEAALPSRREHVTPWMIGDWMLNAEIKAQVGHAPDLSHHRWTVDEPADLEFVRAVYSELGEDFGMEDVLALLERKPELSQINAHIGRNEGYKRSMEEEAHAKD